LPAPPGRPSVNPLRTINVVCLVLNNKWLPDSFDNTRGFTFEAARKFVEKQLRPNTFIGIFTLDSFGLRLVYPFSNNRASLMKAVELAALNKLPAIQSGAGIGLAGLSFQEGVGVDSRNGSPLGTQHEIAHQEIQYLREVDALKGLIGQLRPLPYQKTVLFLSNGLVRPQDQLEYWDSMIHAALDGGVTFYTVDVHGLDAEPSSDPTMTAQALLGYAASLSAQQAAASSQGYTAAPPWPGGKPTTPAQIAALQAWAQSHPGTSIDPSLGMRTTELTHEDDYVQFAVSSANQQEALRELAERTGGFIIANSNNVDELLSRVMEEVDTHYEIAYPPKSERDDGHFRKIEVKLARAGLHVETRDGYFAVPDTGHALAPEEMAGLRALDTQPRPHAFNFLSRAYRFRDSGGRTQYAIAFEMPISNLTATAEEGAHQHRFHASLLAVVKNQGGIIVDRVSKDVPSEVSDDLFEKVRWEFMTYQKAVNLPPARYTVETAVVDHEGNRASTGTFDIDNRQERGIGLSDLAVVRKLENLTTPADPADPFEYTGKRVLPFVTSNLLAGTKPFVFFMIYPEPGNGAKPVARVRLLKDGRTIATLKPDLAAPDAAGGIPMLLQLTDKPGGYEVRATVTQGNSSQERTLQYTLAGPRRK
jgi:VWFA-related protein